jgi:hypothetical protein
MHVVVFIRGEPSYEMHTWGALGEGLIFSIEQGILGARNRVIGVSLSTRILIYDSRLGVPLPSQILEFSNPCIRVLVRIIDDWRFLVPFCVDNFVPEAERTVGQLPVTKIEEVINTTSVDHLPIRDNALDFPIISVKQ